MQVAAQQVKATESLQQSNASNQVAATKPSNTQCAANKSNLIIATKQCKQSSSSSRGQQHAMRVPAQESNASSSSRRIYSLFLTQIIATSRG
jgi:hypothetical protein